MQYEVTLRDAFIQAFIDSLDVVDEAQQPLPGLIKIFTSGKTLLLGETVLPFPSFVQGAPGTCTLSSPILIPIVADGVAAEFELTNWDSTALISGTVAVAGGDINLRTVDLLVGDEVEIENITYVAPE